MRVLLVVFSIVGLALVAGGLLAFENVRRFTQTAATADGVVTANVLRPSRRGYTFHPRVHFRTADGQDISFVSNIGAKPASYQPNDKVPVVYDPRDPSHASIQSVMNVWLLPLILGGLGAVFSSIAGIVAVVRISGARKTAWLQANGIRVQAQITNVMLDPSVRMRGMFPYRIMCQWIDPSANKVYIFKSGQIWFDPTPYIAGKTLNVVVDRDNPRRYWVDTAFLPKPA